MMNKATCLSLLSNAVVVWNTVQMTRIIAQLRANGETIAAEDLARVSPLAFAHVIPNGTYFVRQALRQSAGDLVESLGRSVPVCQATRRRVQCGLVLALGRAHERPGVCEYTAS
jgi:hypothetical protein